MKAFSAPQRSIAEMYEHNRSNSADATSSMVIGLIDAQRKLSSDIQTLMQGCEVAEALQRIIDVLRQVRSILPMSSTFI
jgi:hypothetical protein